MDAGARVRWVSNVTRWCTSIALLCAASNCGGGGEGSARLPDPGDSGAGGGHGGGVGGAAGHAASVGTGGLAPGGGDADTGGSSGAGGLAPSTGGRLGVDAGAGGEREGGTCAESSPCDDGDACTRNDRCTNGTCAGTAVPCDDGVACNGVERCDGATGECTPGTSICGAEVCDALTDTCTKTCAGCLVAGTCFPDGSTSSTNPCAICDVARSTTSFSANTGASCENDGDPCKSAGTCGAGSTCVRTPLASGTSCGSPVPCRAADACDGLGACVPGVPLPLGTECTSHGHCSGDATAPECTCDGGYEVASGGACVDVDECARGTDDCDDRPDACVNSDGSFACQCPAGYVGDGHGPSGCTCPRDDYSPSCESWTDVAVHSDHACGISAGALYCWGKNDDGQLGVGDTLSRVAPARVGSETGWTAVAPGSSHTCGILGGALYCWGGGFGRGLNFATDALAPERVGSESDWVSITAGNGATCAIRSGGALYCWGYDEHGTTGTGSLTSYIPSPTLLPLTGCSSVTLWGATAAAVCSGKVYGWGSGTENVGDGPSGVDQPSPIQLDPSEDWIRVERGNGTACAVNAGGAVSCWGIGLTNAPTPDPARSDWASVEAGLLYACGITTAGDAYCWGMDDVGQLGDGTATRQTAPQLLRGACQRLATGGSTTFGIFDGGLYSWGSNDFGVRGVPVTPRRVGSDSDWTQVDAGFRYTCGIRNGGALYCWGARPSGMITTPVVAPAQVGMARDWTRVAVGWSHACGLRGGALYCWGKNDRGGLGDGTTTEQPDPEQVGTATDWLDVSVGDGTYGHTCGIRAGGALYCWGSNDMGQVGDGSTTNRPSPVSIASSGWSALDLGDDYSCGVQNGGLFCWGDQYGGQLGNGKTSFTPQKTPLRDGTSSTWASVSAGSSHACGLDASALYCWGDNTFGELGFGGTATQPALADSTRTWTGVAAGIFTTCGTTAAGALRCWGWNQSGELGTGEAYATSRPPTVTGADGWQTIAAGAHYFCGIRGGALYCWGQNDSGALGHDENLVPGPVASHLGEN